jgi:pimeloyl-ACP methyl ester carboxylesterase
MRIRLSTRRIASLGMLLCIGLASSACVFMEVKRQQEMDAQLIRLTGTVALAEPERGMRVVVLVRMSSEEDGDVVDHYSRRRDGRFYFVVSDPGTYALLAFHDRNGDLNYDPDEPALGLSGAQVFTLGVAETREGIELVIDPSGRIPVDGPADIEALIARSAQEQLGRSLGQFSTVGGIFELGDPRFGAESGQLGLWRPLDFVAELRPGIFFVEPYDDDRIPVLFIHGMTGHPNEFEFLVDALDRSRFQPWFYFYPSGGSLQKVVGHANQVLMSLHARHRFRRMFVVAHSMGGLVGRGLILEHEEGDGEEIIPLFVSISAPWGGHEAAQAGVDRAPAVVEAWRDMAPDSAFQRDLLYEDPEAKTRPRQLPDHVTHHLLFGYQRDAGSLGVSSDSVITIGSQLLPTAQDQAVEVYGIDATHAGILRNPATAERLNRILDGASR